MAKKALGVSIREKSDGTRVYTVRWEEFGGEERQCKSREFPRPELEGTLEAFGQFIPYLCLIPASRINYTTIAGASIKYPKIVLAQAILETGRFRSRVCNEHNNLFGLRHSKGYYSFSNWEESVIAYRDKVQYKHRDGEGYYSFLKRIGYASAPDYINKVREIASQL